MPNARLTLHLASGTKITTLLKLDEDEDIEDITKEVHDALSDGGRPGWRLIENVVVHSQTVSAAEVEELT